MAVFFYILLVLLHTLRILICNWRQSIEAIIIGKLCNRLINLITACNLKSLSKAHLNHYYLMYCQDAKEKN